MTNDLKHRFDQLVADPPPSNGVPSEAVFARVRKVRRRRTATVVTLGAAAVVAVAVAASNLTGIQSAPPVSGTPGTPTTSIVSSPSATPNETPSTTPAKSTPAGVTSAGHTPKNQTPPPSSSNTPNAPQLGVRVTLDPTVTGRVVTMKVTVTGTALVPTADGGKALSTNASFIDLLGGTQYSFGDGAQSGSDAGSVNCKSGTQPTTGQQTYTLQNDSAAVPNPGGSHTYAAAGTYKFSYTVKYCGNNGWVPVTKTVKVTVK